MKYPIDCPMQPSCQASDKRVCFMIRYGEDPDEIPACGCVCHESKEPDQDESPFAIVGEMDLALGIIRDAVFHIENVEDLAAAHTAFQRYDEQYEHLIVALTHIELQSSLLLLKLRELMNSVSVTVCETCHCEQCKCDQDWQNADGPRTLPDIEGR